MHVVMIIHGYAPRIGGAERQVGALAPALQALGLEVSILTRRLPGTSAFERINGVPVYRLPAAGPKAIASLSFTLCALARLRRLRPDIVHAHEFISPATVALIAHSLYRIPFVLTPHLSGPQGDVQKMDHKFLGAKRLAALRKECAAFIAISSEIDAELDSAGIPSERRASIGNGVDPARFFPVDFESRVRLRRELGIPADALLTAYAGRLVPVKRVDRLVTIWPEIRRSLPSAYLAIAGAGPLEGELKAAAGDGIQFLGGLADVRPLMQAADILVLPSDAEGLPVSLLEAMSCGLPCVATRVGGVPEAVIDGKTGLLIPPGDAESLSTAILQLLKTPNLRATLGRNARERILERCTLDQMALRTRALYQAVLNKEAIR